MALKCDMLLYTFWNIKQIPAFPRILDSVYFCINKYHFSMLIISQISILDNVFLLVTIQKHFQVE